MSSSTVASILNSSDINLIIALIGIFICLLLPILIGCPFCNLSVYENSHLNESLSSVQVHVAGATLFVSGLPMALDLIMDSISRSHRSLCRVTITTVTLLFGAQITLQYDYFYLFKSYAASYLFALWCYRIVLINGCMFCLCNSSPNIFTVKKTGLVSLATICLSTF